MTGPQQRYHNPNHTKNGRPKAVTLAVSPAQRNTGRQTEDIQDGRQRHTAATRQGRPTCRWRMWVQPNSVPTAWGFALLKRGQAFTFKLLLRKPAQAGNIPRLPSTKQLSHLHPTSSKETRNKRSELNTVKLCKMTPLKEQKVRSLEKKLVDWIVVDRLSKPCSSKKLQDFLSRRRTEDRAK